MKELILIWLSLLCSSSPVLASMLQQTALPPLPQALSNNAVAQVTIAGSPRLYSFYGIAPGLVAQQILRHAYEFDFDAMKWRTIPAAPGPARLGSVAVGAAGKVFIFGGYTVAGDSSEVSQPDAWRYDPLRQTYERMPDMPVAVDDTAAVLYRDRYIYLISGWSNDQAVTQVQLFDTLTEKWQMATPFSGVPVFGHAAGIIDNEMILCGGAKVLSISKNQRHYSLSRACFYGLINPKQITAIKWKEIVALDGSSRYRAAASGGIHQASHIVFAGGSLRPYNYNGMGYDGEPANPVDDVVAYNLHSQRWEKWGRLPVSGMDFRGLLALDKGWLTIAGMERNQKVTQAVRHFLPPETPLQ